MLRCYWQSGFGAWATGLDVSPFLFSTGQSEGTSTSLKAQRELWLWKAQADR